MACSETNRDPMRLQREALVADLHSDTALRMVEEGFDFSTRDTSGHMDIPRLLEGGVDLQVFACYLDTETPLEKCRATVDELIDSLEAQIFRNPDRIATCRTSGEAEDIIKSGRIAAFLAIENGVAIANDLDNLKHFYDRGIRYMTLTHVLSNDWCISSSDTTTPAFHGLTDFGRDVVRKMNELGMIVDISHAAPSAVEEILKVTEDPIIASHSCVHEICAHDRNLTDDQIRAIAANGGMIGINFYEGYLSQEFNDIDAAFTKEHQAEFDSIDALYPKREDRRKTPLYRELSKRLNDVKIDVGTVVDHIDHIVRLVGAEHVGLGSDFDGVHRMPNGLEDCSKLLNITTELIRRGYPDDDIKKSLGGNFIRIFRQVCDN